MAESSEEYDRDTDCESAEPSAKKKKTKFTGSFLYKTKFSEEWKKTCLLCQLYLAAPTIQTQNCMHVEYLVR